MSSNIVTIRLYRTLLKQCRTLNKLSKQNNNPEQNLIFLQTPLNPRNWGHATKYTCKTLRPALLSKTSFQDNEVYYDIFYYLYKNIDFENATNLLKITFSAMDEESKIGGGDKDEDELRLLSNLIKMKQDSDKNLKILEQLKKENRRLKQGYNTVSSFEEVEDEEMNVEQNHDIYNVLVSSSDIYKTIQNLYRNACTSTTSVMDQHNLVMNVIRLFNCQLDMLRYTSFSLNSEHKIRVIATSRYIGRSPASISNKLLDETNQPKHRFTYRIRIENLNEIPMDDGSDVKDNQTTPSTTIQLLGRSWNIVEIANKGEERIAANVDAPFGGAVGHLPVLQPGEVFEYMSGCDLATNTGKMNGKFYMALVDPKTKSSKLGDENVGKDLEMFDLNVDSFFLEATNQ